MVNYYALHYHMKHSGVFFVIENVFSCLKKYSSMDLNLIYSSEKAVYENKDVKVINIPEVGYDEKTFENKEKLLERAAEIKDKIKSRLDLSEECVMHCHNINLLKNSYLGAALGMLAKELEEEDFTLIFQVHDFAEENREDRLNLMLNCTGKEDRKFGASIAYPLGKNILYCTINSRDKGLLEKTGIPEERISLFPNGIDTEKLSAKPKDCKGLIEDIGKYAEANSYRFEKDRKRLAYPVKVIRRKNVIEALLILKLLNSIKDEWQLFITLDAHSPADREYSEKVKRYVKGHGLPVVIGFGYELISPEESKDMYGMNDLFGIADAIITTSIQEGFGFTFLEGWVAGKKVIGRGIDFIFEDLEKNGLEIEHFYDNIDIDGNDFADYSYDKQFELLEKADYDALKEQLQKMIDLLYDGYNIVEHNKKKIIENYSLKAYADRLFKIIEKAKKLSYADVEIDNKELIGYFRK
ncbi:hypothetical protein GF336_03770 [Candidatus Woesearchaeota archaeon]|nr:hypothetical protein [Candidatus Woesearchaeota archaeon]